MTQLVDHRSTEDCRNEQCLLRAQLMRDLTNLDPIADLNVIEKTADLMLEARRAGFVELYLNEYDEKAVYNRINNCSIFCTSFNRGRQRGLTYGERMVSVAVLLSSEREKLIQGIVDHSMRSPAPIILIDSVQSKEVRQRLKRATTEVRSPFVRVKDYVMSVLKSVFK